LVKQTSKVVKEVPGRPYSISYMYQTSIQPVPQPSTRVEAAYMGGEMDSLSIPLMVSYHAKFCSSRTTIRASTVTT